MPKTFELIRPKSLSDPVYADYEYLIRWIGRDGSEYLYMFYDAEIDLSVDTDVINQEDSTKIRSLIRRVGEKITLTANDLSLSDLSIINQIFENPIVRRIKMDDTEDRYAPESNSFNYRLRDGRYAVSFTVVKTESKVWR